MKREKLFYLACIFALALSNGIVMWKYLQLRDAVTSGRTGAASTRADSRNLASLLSQPIETPNGESVLIGDVQARYVVLFVFTHSDCSPCLSEMSKLHEIANVRSDIKVYGLMSYASPDEIEQTRRNFGVSFPILSDLSGETAKNLNLPKTPWKLVINIPSKRIVYEDPPSLTDAEQEAFITRVSNLSTS